MSQLPLLAVPNVSEGRDPDTIKAIAAAFTRSGHARLLDVHSDADHHRSVFTLAGAPGALAPALLEGAALTVQRIDLRSERGLHPHVGALDVLPIVYLDGAQRGAACAEALVLAGDIGWQLGVPVFLYGPLARDRTRAELRRGGLPGLSERIRAGALTPDFGPSRPPASAGVTLVAAREPLVAFNLELAPPASVADAKRIAGLIREGGSEGLPGVRAIGLALVAGPAALPAVDPGAHPRSGRAPGGTARARAQVSLNIERPLQTPLADVVRAVRMHAPLARAELVGLAPREALAGFPNDLEMPGFDPARHVIENALGL